LRREVTSLNPDPPLGESRIPDIPVKTAQQAAAIGRNLTTSHQFPSLNIHHRTTTAPSKSSTRRTLEPFFRARHHDPHFPCELDDEIPCKATQKQGEIGQSMAKPEISATGFDVAKESSR
jgi:hypothetical protein